MIELKRGQQLPYFKNKPLLRTKIAAFGQGAGKVADIFAQFKTDDGKAAYEVFAFNSNDADLASLQHIAPTNRVSLKLDGFGKNPASATRRFKREPELRKKVADFVSRLNYNEDGSVDDLHLYIAAMGGGTGTSTIYEAVTEHYNQIILPVAQELIEKKSALWNEDPEYYADQNELLLEVMEDLSDRVPKLGLILITPPHREGADTMAQSYNYSAKLWALATGSAISPIGFLNFPDNEYFFNEFMKLSTEEQNAYKSVHNWANEQIAYAFHGILTSCGLSTSSKLLDRQDMKRLLLEDTGTLTISHSRNRGLRPDSTVAEIVQQFENLVGTNILHQALPLVEEVETGTGEKEQRARQFTNLGVISVTDIAASRINGETASANVLNMLTDKLAVVGNVFDSFLSTANMNESSAYLISKVNTLPDHLDALRKEHEKVVEKAKSLESIQVDVKTIQKQVNFNLGADMFAKIPQIEKEPKPVVNKPDISALQGLLNLKK